MRKFYSALLLCLCFISSFGQSTNSYPWQTITQTLLPYDAFIDLEVIDANHLFVASTANIIYSKDAGTSFKLLTKPAGVINAISFSDTLNGVIASSGASIFITADGGLTWTKKTVNLAASNTNLINVKRTQGGVIFTGFFKSTDNGTTWISYDASLEMKLNSKIEFTDAATGFIDSWNTGFYKTMNGGQTWSIINYPQSVYSINTFDFYNDQNAVAAGSGILYVTTNAGNSWNSVTLGNSSAITNLNYKNTNAIYGLIGGKVLYNAAGSTNSDIYSLGNSLSDIAFGSGTGYVCGVNGYIARFSQNAADTVYLNNGTWQFDQTPSAQSIVKVKGQNTLNQDFVCKSLIIAKSASLVLQNAKISSTGTVINNGSVTVKLGSVLTFTGNVIGNKLNQEILFNAIAPLFMGSYIKLTAQASSGLTTGYTMVTNSALTLSGNLLTATGIGTATIQASQTGDANWNSAFSTPQAATVKSNSSFTYDYQLANWYNNKQSATVLTYDDWSPGQHDIAAIEHVNRNMPATFYVTLGNMWRADDYSRMEALIAVNCEIGNHTKTHPHLNQVSPAQLKTEISDTKKTLDLNLPDQKFKVITFAYPYGDYNDTVIDTVMIKHIAARAIQESVTFPYNFAATPLDYYKVPTTEVNSTLGISAFTNTLNRAISEGGLLTYMIHSIGPTDTWFDNISTAQYTSMLDTIKSRDYITWNTTFLNAIRYHREKNSATLSILTDNNAQTILSLTDTMANNFLYSHPLTVMKVLNTGDTAVRVTQSGTNIPFVLSNGLLTFNAVPDAGNIVIYKTVVTADIDKTLENNSLSVYPNPSTGLVHITNNKEILAVKVFDVAGNEISNFKGTSSSNIDFTISKSGLYIVKIQLIDSVEVRKVIIE